MNTKLLPLAAALALCNLAYAGQPLPTSQLQQIQPAPQLPQPAPQVTIQSPSAASSTANDTTQIKVNTLHIVGIHQYNEATLLAVTGFKPGSLLSLSDLRVMAAKIADYYHQRGYFLAQATVTQASGQSGVVTITVLEGTLGAIKLDNHSRVHDVTLNGVTADLHSGDTVGIAPLERSLLLLTDLPGVDVKSTLIPGASVGASDLIVNVTPGRTIDGSVDADNEGNRYTGANRIGATVDFNELAGLGDVLTLRGLTSGSGLNYSRIAYQVQAGEGHVGAAYTAMAYQLGGQYAPLQANGTAEIDSLYGSYPLIRSRNNNLYAQLDFDNKTFQDKQYATGSVDNKLIHAWMTSVNGAHTDTLGGGGIMNYSVTWTHGQVNIETPSNLANDAVTVQTHGPYNKYAFNTMRLQHVTDNLSFYAAVNGQFADKNLDISEKMELGGANAVRAYPEGEDYADEGYVVNLELRQALPKLTHVPGQFQLIAFVDSGAVTFNKTLYAGYTGANTANLSGAGVGVNWIANNDFVIKAYIARRIDQTPAVSAPDSLSRFWLQGVKYF